MADRRDQVDVGPDAGVAPLTPRIVLARLSRLSAEIADRPPAPDTETTFPAEDLSRLRAIGALEVFSGDAATPMELFEALRLTGRANLSLGRIFEGHVNGARLVAWYGSPGQRARLARDLQSGRTFGVWNTEPLPGVQIAAGPDAMTLQGAKSYATGAGHIDRAIVTGRTAAGEKQMVIADASDPGRADPTAWRVSGMRATVSGTYDLTGLPVDDDTRLGVPGDYEREPRFSAGAWRFTAVQLGGAERILTRLRDHLIGSPAGQDPIHRARFADAYAAVRSADFWVREAAVQAEASDAGPHAITTVLVTRGVVEAAALKVIEAATRSVGTKAFFEDHPLDAGCRDLALYLRQPAPDAARDRAAMALLEHDSGPAPALW